MTNIKAITVPYWIRCNTWDDTIPLCIQKDGSSATFHFLEGRDYICFRGVLDKETKETVCIMNKNRMWLFGGGCFLRESFDIIGKVMREDVRRFVESLEELNQIKIEKLIL